MSQDGPESVGDFAALPKTSVARRETSDELTCPVSVTAFVVRGGVWATVWLGAGVGAVTVDRPAHAAVATTTASAPRVILITMPLPHPENDDRRPSGRRSKTTNHERVSKLSARRDVVAENP